MIPFFRRLRKQLADDNKPLKYMRYAIGEIVLVVIGILIALSINNWNEERKDAVLEKKYLESIRKELEINIKTATSEKQFNDFQIQNVETILACLDNDSLNNPTQLVVAIEHVGFQTTINYTKDVWNELYSTGNIGILSNDSIKNNLVELYRNINEVSSLEEREWSKYNFGYRRLVGDVLPPKLRTEMAKHLSPTKYIGEQLLLENNKDIIEKLRKLNGLNGYLVDIKIVRRVSSNFFLAPQIELMKKIIVMIDEELQ